MALNTALQIGRTGLVAAQIGIDSAGNNMANAATEGYSRRALRLSPIRGQSQGAFSVGRGVLVADVQRQVDEALQARLRTSVSNEQAAIEKQELLDQLESVMGELSQFDLSTELADFFNGWSEAANLTAPGAVLVEQGRTLATFMQSQRQDLNDLRAQIERQIDQQTRRANEIIDQIAGVNAQIATSEVGGSTANSLRDRRDELLQELSELVNIETAEDERGIVDVLIGSEPVVLAGESLGLEIERRSDGNRTTTSVRVSQTEVRVEVEGGSLGGLLDSRDGSVDETIDRLDTLAKELIFSVNRFHSTSQNAGGLTSATSTMRIPTDDQTKAFDDATNTTFKDAAFMPETGSFIVHSRNPASGAVEEKLVTVDMSGDAADNTTAADIAAAIDEVAGLNASFDAAGRLSITSDTGFEFSFEDDTSGVLATLGVNSYFTGSSARDIAVRQDLIDDPTKVGIGAMRDGSFVENAAALDIAGLQGSAIEGLGSISTQDYWQDTIQQIANEADTARTDAESSRVVRENLSAQRSALSGVSVDEESINLLTFQTQYQGSARVISTADELINTLIALI